MARMLVPCIIARSRSISSNASAQHEVDHSLFYRNTASLLASGVLLRMAGRMVCLNNSVPRCTPFSAAETTFAELRKPDARSDLHSVKGDRIESVRRVGEDPRAVNSSMQSEISRLERRIAAIVSGISSSSNFITTVTLRAAKETSCRTPIFRRHESVSLALAESIEQK